MKKLFLDGKTVCVVAGLHGNEKGPVRALQDSGLDFILGNPEAYTVNTRFINSDLNASFGLEAESYESKRATELLHDINPEDIVIDFHTTSAVTEPFVIITDKEMLSYAEFTGLKSVVLMTHNIKKEHALINHRNGISIEISGYDTPESYDTTRSILSSLEKGIRTPITVYEVYGRITEPGEYKNFVEHADGFYPILVGEQAYDFIGLKARKLS